jgi:protein PsiE
MKGQFKDPIMNVEKLLLIVVAIATCCAAIIEIKTMILEMHVTLADLLLLFIYSEILGMVAVFCKSQRIPISIPMFIAITALCRLIILKGDGSDPTNILIEAGAILLIALAILVINYRPTNKLLDE